MPSPSTRTDNGAIYGQTYDVTIDGSVYTLKTLSHGLPTSGAIIKDKDGLYKGGGWVQDRETCEIEVDAIVGVAVPPTLTSFASAFHGFTSKLWQLENLTIKSGNETLRTYSGSMAEVKT